MEEALDLSFDRLLMMMLKQLHAFNRKVNTGALLCFLLASFVFQEKQELFEICALLVFYAEWIGSLTPTFRGNLLVLFVTVKQPKMDYSIIASEC